MRDITPIFEAIISLVVVLCTTFVIPYIKEKVDQTTLQNVNKWTRIAVQTAEMIYRETGAGKEKKEYVLKFLNNIGLTYDEAQIDALIESAVYELKKEAEDAA